MSESTGRPPSDGSSGSDVTDAEELGTTPPADAPAPSPTDGSTGTIGAAGSTKAAPRSARPARPAGPVVPPKAKAKTKVATAETRVATARAKAVAPNPEWWVPVLVTLLVLGLAWIVVFYISQGAWPVAAFGYGNLVAGFVLLISGFAMAMRWR